MPLQEIDDDGWRDRGTHHAAAVEDADGERAVLFTEELGQHLDAAGIVTAFAGAHPEPRKAKLQCAAGEGLEARGSRPPHHGTRKRDAYAEAIHQGTHRQFAGHHAELKGRHHAAVLLIAEVERLTHYRRQHRQRLPVNKVHHGNRKEQAEDQPAFAIPIAVSFRHGADRLAHPFRIGRNSLPTKSSA